MSCPLTLLALPHGPKANVSSTRAKAYWATWLLLPTTYYTLHTLHTSQDVSSLSELHVFVWLRGCVVRGGVVAGSSPKNTAKANAIGQRPMSDNIFLWQHFKLQATGHNISLFFPSFSGYRCTCKITTLECPQVAKYDLKYSSYY